MKEASEAVSSLSKAGSPAELAAKEAELGKSAFEKSVATMREMAEILVKSSEEATNKINARVAASLDEIAASGRRRSRRCPREIASGRPLGRPLLACHRRTAYGGGAKQKNKIPRCRDALMMEFENAELAALSLRSRYLCS